MYFNKISINKSGYKVEWYPMLRLTRGSAFPGAPYQNVGWKLKLNMLKWGKIQRREVGDNEIRQ